MTFVYAGISFASDSGQSPEIVPQNLTSQIIQSPSETRLEVSNAPHHTVSITIDNGRLKAKAEHALDVTTREIDRAVTKAPDQLQTFQIKAKNEGKRVKGRLKKIF